jgi:predicted dehydrogenase
MCKVAFIGAGYMTVEHIKAFKDIDSVSLVGIHSRTKERANNLAKDFGILGVYDSIEDLYNFTKADLVVISVPELSTKDVVLKAFNFPWKCLIEKPVGYNLEEAEFITDYANKKGIVAYVALNRRHYSSTRTLLKKLDINNSNRIIFIQDQEDLNEAIKFGQPELVIKNWMFANSIHLIDMFCILGRGKVTKVENIIKWDPNKPYFVMSKIDFESGDIGIYHAVWNAPGPWSVSVSTLSEKFELKPIEFCNILKLGSRKAQEIEIENIDIKYKPGLRHQAELFVKSLNYPTDLPTLQGALRSMDIIDKIYNFKS